MGSRKKGYGSADDREHERAHACSQARSACLLIQEVTAPGFVRPPPDSRHNSTALP